jgi:hypothetical protein
MRLITENIVPIERRFLVATPAMVSPIVSVINVIMTFLGAERRFIVCHVSSVSAGAFWPSWVWLPVYGQEPRQRFCLRFSAFSLRQPLIGKALAGRGANHSIKPIERVDVHVAVVQAERELIDISGFKARLIPRGWVINLVPS